MKFYFNHPKAPIFWGTTLLSIQGIYLLLEFAFNARLVDSALVFNPEYFEDLSFIGRCLSGFGCTLLILGFVKYPQTGLNKHFYGMLGAALLGFPIIFFGQEMLIDRLVDSSTAEQRVHGQYLTLLKRGLANHSVIFKGIEYEAEEIEEADVKTFIQAIGFTVFFAPEFIQSVAENSDRILDNLAKREEQKRIGPAYKVYREARKRAGDLVEQYNNVNVEFQQEVNENRHRAKEVWQKTFVELKNAWDKAQSSEVRQKTADAVDMLSDRLEMYFLAKDRCRGSQRCISKLNVTYRQKMLEIFGREVLPEYWCEETPAKVGKKLVGGIFVNYTEPAKLNCDSRNRRFIRNRLIEAQGTIPLKFSRFDKYMSSIDVSELLRAQLAEDGIKMPQGYRLHDHNSFINGVASELDRLAKEAIASATQEEFGMRVEPGLSSEKFIAHDVVQVALKSALGLDIEHPVVKLNLSESAFNEQVLGPKIKKELLKEHQRLLEKTPLFSDGGIYEKDGKAFVRGVLIPPIAMGLSLFFALLNLSSLISGLAIKRGMKKPIATRLRSGFLALVLVLPLTLSHSISDSVTFERMVNETEEKLGSGRFFVTWLTNLQPIIHPIGGSIANLLGLFSPDEYVNEDHNK
jgi:hypothetical protein